MTGSEMRADGNDTPMRHSSPHPCTVMMHDFGGYAFAVRLSRELARRGHAVTHLYCPTYISGKGRVSSSASDPASFCIETVCLRRYDKHSVLRRPLQEASYGMQLASHVRALRPQIVVSANTPLIAQAIMLCECRRLDIPFVFWQQDVLSVAIRELSAQRFSPAVAATLARPFRILERWIARRSDIVVPISRAFIPTLVAWGIPMRRIRVIENWAPLDELPLAPRNNAWAVAHGLVGKRVLLYSGTLGLKHGATQLTELASRFAHVPDIRVVVVSEGEAADEIRREVERNRVQNVLCLPFQPHECLSEVFASADVLIALLEEQSVQFAVPSKVLSYLCAGRPVLAAMSSTNPAAETVKRAGVGIVVEPGDIDALAAAADTLVSNTRLRQRLGHNARTYAEVYFDISTITDVFEQLLVERVGAVGSVA